MFFSRPRPTIARHLPLRWDHYGLAQQSDASSRCIVSTFQNNAPERCGEDKPLKAVTPTKFSRTSRLGNIRAFTQNKDAYGQSKDIPRMKTQRPNGLQCDELVVARRHKSYKGKPSLTIRQKTLQRLSEKDTRRLPRVKHSTAAMLSKQLTKLRGDNGPRQQGDRQKDCDVAHK